MLHKNRWIHTFELWLFCLVNRVHQNAQNLVSNAFTPLMQMQQQEQQPLFDSFSPESHSGYFRSFRFLTVTITTARTARKVRITQSSFVHVVYWMTPMWSTLFAASVRQRIVLNMSANEWGYQLLSAHLMWLFYASFERRRCERLRRSTQSSWCRWPHWCVTILCSSVFQFQYIEHTWWPIIVSYK